jgi:hypothetical protein
MELVDELIQTFRSEDTARLADIDSSIKVGVITQLEQIEDKKILILTDFVVNSGGLLTNSHTTGYATNSDDN